jgi:hypothetical protein
MQSLQTVKTEGTITAAFLVHPKRISEEQRLDLGHSGMVGNAQLSPRQDIATEVTINETSSTIKGSQSAIISIVQPKVVDKNDEMKIPAKSKCKREKKPANPKAHYSLLGLDNIHTLSILSWRRGRSAFVAMFDPVKESNRNEKDNEDEDDDDDDDYDEHGWHITETVVLGVYRAIGFFVLISQITFLWSLLDQFASDFRDTDMKRKPFPLKYTPAMTDVDFGTKPLNLTIADWDAARTAANVKQCKDLVLQCGALWAAKEACPQEGDIAFYCYPWDYEKYLNVRGSI